MIDERKLQDRQVWHAARSGTHVDDVIGSRRDIARQCVRTCEARDHETHSTHCAFHEKRRKKRRIFRHIRNETFFFHRDRQISLVRRRTHGIGPRRFGLSLQVFQERGESIECLELMRVDCQEMSGFVVKMVIPREQHQSRGVRSLDHDISHHDLEVLDALGSWRNSIGLHVYLVFGLQHVFRTRATTDVRSRLRFGFPFRCPAPRHPANSIVP